MIEPRPYRLKNRIQHYAWGTRNREAFIPRLMGMKPEKDKPYAELWMGVHPTAPSAIVIDGDAVPLNRFIDQYPVEILGNRVARQFAGKLPFLFKVLSAGETLSIQAHPNKRQAVDLHKRDPQHYPDDNHKPEIAIALDSLTAFVGFKPYDHILSTLERYSEISDFVGREIAGALKQVRHPTSREQQRLIHKLYSSMLNRSQYDEVALGVAINRLYDRLIRIEPRGQVEAIFIELRQSYPGPDVGLFSIFLLNLIHLHRGQGIFLKSGIPHAYVKGNIVECMANSDNVVRAGLTSKFKDVTSLIDILTYETTAIPILGKGEARSDYVYETPTREFRVSRWEMEKGDEKKVARKSSPCICLMTQGEICLHWKRQNNPTTQFFKKGDSFLVPALMPEFTIEAASSTQIYLAEVPQ